MKNNVATEAAVPNRAAHLSGRLASPTRKPAPLPARALLR